MILDAPPFINRIDGDADIFSSIFVNAKTCGTISRLVHKSCLGTEYFPVCIFILYPTQKQIRQIQSFSVADVVYLWALSTSRQKLLSAAAFRITAMS